MSDDDRTLRIDGAEVTPAALDWMDVYKRPVQVEAVQLPAPFTVETMEGMMEADAGHYLLRGVEGELYPCDPGVFAQTYRTDASNVPKYSPNDLRSALREFQQNTLDHVGVGVTDTNARAGAEALARLLREGKP